MKNTLTRMRPEVRKFLNLDGPLMPMPQTALVPAETVEVSLDRKIRNTPMTTLCRNGTFYASLHPENQCGHEGANQFAFEVEATVIDLDFGGFVADALDVDRVLLPLRN